MRKQNLCHFCKAILADTDNDLFIACRYRSSRMGPPQHDPDQSLATLYMSKNCMVFEWPYGFNFRGRNA